MDRSPVLTSSTRVQPQQMTSPSTRMSSRSSSRSSRNQSVITTSRATTVTENEGAHPEPSNEIDYCAAMKRTEKSSFKEVQELTPTKFWKQQIETPWYDFMGCKVTPRLHYEDIVLYIGGSAEKISLARGPHLRGLATPPITLPDVEKNSIYDVTEESLQSPPTKRAKQANKVRRIQPARGTPSSNSNKQKTPQHPQHSVQYHSNAAPNSPKPKLHLGTGVSEDDEDDDDGMGTIIMMLKYQGKQIPIAQVGELLVKKEPASEFMISTGFQLAAKLSRPTTEGHYVLGWFLLSLKETDTPGMYAKHKFLGGDEFAVAELKGGVEEVMMSTPDNLLQLNILAKDAFQVVQTA